MTAKKQPPAKPKPAASNKPAAPQKKGIFSQPLNKPQPWSFGGRGARGPHDEGAKAQPDAERLAGKSRKVH